jgi:hypothetical protein
VVGSAISIRVPPLPRNAAIDARICTVTAVPKKRDWFESGISPSVGA